MFPFPSLCYRCIEQLHYSPYIYSLNKYPLIVHDTSDLMLKLEQSSRHTGLTVVFSLEQATLLNALLLVLPSVIKTSICHTWFLLASTCSHNSSLALNLNFPFFVLLYRQRHISAIAMVTCMLLSCLFLWLAFSTPYFHSTCHSCSIFLQF